jgi:alpha-amylase/alpha-mannosidase (GH57 family)
MTQHTRYLCIHGHFYQPPRENPWLEAIERQDSAYPFHDWNERVTAESYAPNAVSRILDGDGRIRELSNNYERISFNFGPTLLQWLEDHDSTTYQAVLDADVRSATRFGGHGSALAQVFNHMIMPLANDRDRRTQVIWGIRDFEHRFGRAPEGMWLAETAANTASLEALAEQGIRFTVLAPNQAARVRPLPDTDGSAEPAADPDAEVVGAPTGDEPVEQASEPEDDGWHDVTGSRVDPTRPYLCRLPSGREIVIFFYDGPISRAVAFEGLLRSGDRFANRLTDMFHEGRTWPELGHIATDGETYGHHHRHGDMALARALRVIEERKDIRLTNYGEYLELHPPTWEVEIVEDSSWSCAHGVERWRSDCGCSTGGDPEWNQAWREPLRSALDGLRDELAPRYEREAGKLVEDPWAARDDYIDVVLDRSPDVIAAFLDRHAVREMDTGERVRLMKLLEGQRQAMLMYTSCGWFFNELSGIETVQVLRYAGRAIQLAEELSHDDIEAPFLEALSDARSNLPSHGDGRRIYDRTVRNARVDLLEVGAHFAISSLFEDPESQTREYCYDLDVSEPELREAGRARLATGLITVTSRVTKEVEVLSYGALHLGDHTIHAGVRPFEDEAAFEAMRADVSAPFESADFTETIRTLDRHFPDGTYNLRSLFRDQRRQVLDQIIQSTIVEAESHYRQIYDHTAPLMRFMHDLHIPPPTALSLAGEYVLNTDLVREVSNVDMDLDRVRALLEGAARREIMLDVEGLGFAYQKTLEAMAASLAESPDDLTRLERLDGAVSIAEDAPFKASLWTVQNRIYDLRRDHSGTVRAAADAGRPDAIRWLEVFRRVARAVGVAVD